MRNSGYVRWPRIVIGPLRRRLDAEKRHGNARIFARELAVVEVDAFRAWLGSRGQGGMLMSTDRATGAPD